MARLSGGGLGARMPGHKLAARRKKPAEQEKKPRKKRQHGFGRTRMEPARRVVHAPESCPECHTTLNGGWVQRTREVIDIPAAPAEVTEHVFMARTCPLCRKRRLPQDSLKGLAAGRQRLGVNLSSLIVTLREEARLPLRTIQWYLRTFPHLIAIFFLSLLLRGAVGLVPHQCLAALRTWSCPLGRWCPGLSGVLLPFLDGPGRLRSAVPASPAPAGPRRGCSAYTSRFWTLRAWVDMKFRRGSTTSPISRVNTPSAWAASSTSTLSICLPSGSMVVSQS